MKTSNISVLSQTGFDSLGPEVRTMRVASGRTVNYIDEGQAEWQPLLFFGGAGTTVRAFGLLDFARTLRTELGVRVISVERNGLGGTVFNPDVGFAEYAADTWSVLDSLGVTDVSVVAISGGGPYAAWLAAAAPQRIRSLHLACAYSDNLAGDLGGATFDADQVARNPVDWWTFPPESAVHRIPGFTDSVVEEALRGVYALGRDTPPDGLRQAFDLCQKTTLPDLGGLRAPSFLYWGRNDTLVPEPHRLRWREQLPNVALERVYDGEGHDVQYRHWDQILADVVFQGEREILTLGGESLLATPQAAAELRAAGATDGIAAWSAC